MTTPTQVPAELIAGDTWSWTRTLADYPAGTWSATYYFEKADFTFSAAATQSGTDHAVTVTAGVSAAVDFGRYLWRLRVTSGGVVRTIEQGWTDVLPDPSAAGNFDHRTTARIMLDNIEAYLRDPTNIAAASYSIGGRSLSRWSRSELIAERSRLQSEVRSEEAAERIAAGLGNPRRLYVRFDRV